MLCMLPKDINREPITSKAHAFMAYAVGDNDDEQETDEDVEAQEQYLFEHTYMNYE